MKLFALPGLCLAPIDRRLRTYLDLVLISSVVGYLSLRGWTNITLILLLIPALPGQKRYWADLSQTGLRRHALTLALALALPFLAVLISQTLRHDWLARNYDAPVRMLLSGLLLACFFSLRLDFSRLLQLTAAPALVATLISILADPASRALWGGRYANNFVDPNAMATYCLVLVGFCLFSLDLRREAHRGLQALQFVGMACGFWILLGTGGRGSMVAAVPLLLLWLSLKWRQINAKYLLIAAVPMIVVVALMVRANPAMVNRILEAPAEVMRWLQGTEVDTSAGIRLSMWRITWTLFLHNPLQGYGDTGYLPLLKESWVSAMASKDAIDTLALGPHNEFLANLLRYGVAGGVAVLGLFLLPLAWFWRHRHHPTAAMAAQQGLALSLGLIFCSLTLEVITLKYTATFYGLMVAGLSARILWSAAESLPENAHVSA